MTRLNPHPDTPDQLRPRDYYCSDCEARHNAVVAEKVPGQHAQHQYRATLTCGHTVVVAFTGPGEVREDVLKQLMSEPLPAQSVLTGGDNDYYLVYVPEPKRLPPYTMEVEDVVEAMNMEFAEANIFAGAIRLCKVINGVGKPGNTEVYEAQKLVYYSQRALAKAERRQREREQLEQGDS